MESEERPWPQSEQAEPHFVFTRSIYIGLSLPLNLWMDSGLGATDSRRIAKLGEISAALDLHTIPTRPATPSQVFRRTFSLTSSPKSGLRTMSSPQLCSTLLPVVWKAPMAHGPRRISTRLLSSNPTQRIRAEHYTGLDYRALLFGRIQDALTRVNLVSLR